MKSLGEKKSRVLFNYVRRRVANWDGAPDWM
jgi:hypothetical protein